MVPAHDTGRPQRPRVAGLTLGRAKCARISITPHAIATAPTTYRDRAFGGRCSQWRAASPLQERCAAHLPPGAVQAQRECPADDQEAATADVVVQEAEIGRDVACEERAPYDGRRQQHHAEEKQISAMPGRARRSAERCAPSHSTEAVLRRCGAGQTEKAVRMSATHTKTKNLTILKALRMTAMTSKMAIVRARLACPTASTHGTENTVWPRLTR